MEQYQYHEHSCSNCAEDDERTETDADDDESTEADDDDDERAATDDSDTDTDTDEQVRRRALQGGFVQTHSFICKREHWASVRRYHLYYLTPRRYDMFRRTPRRNPRELPKAGDQLRFFGGSFQDRRLLGTARVAELYHNGYSGHIHLVDITNYLFD
jgi:Ni/Co efflux regulator RcnB